MSNTSYYLYQKYEQRGGQDPIPVYPNYWSVDGDGTMPKVKKMDNDPSCGYVPPVTAIYRWVNIDITKDYVCNECPQYRTISTGYTCVGYDKHYLDEYQVSYDAGATWQTLSSSTGSLIETDSEYCGYVPPVIAQKFRATYNDSTTYSAACDSSTELTIATTKPSGYEYSAMTSAVIGDCVTSIGDSTFRDCISLTSIDIPSGVTSIGGSAFGDCRSLTSINIPSGVTSIGKSAFRNCSGLTSINIPSGVTSISNNVFNACSSLTSIDIPSGVTSIGYAAFTNCRGLTSIVIPSGVTSIGSRAFEYCTSLSSITVNASTPPTLSNASAFNNTNNCPIYVPCESIQLYRSAWSEYSERIQKLSGSCDFKAHITYNNDNEVEIECDSSNVLTSGETSSGYYRYNITSAVIGDCVTSIGNAAFSMMDNASASTFSSVTFTSKNVTTIGDDAFLYCHKLTEFCEYSTNYCDHAEANFTSVGSRAFMGCTGLTWMNVTGLTSLPSGVFGYCTSLSTVSLNSGLTSIGSAAFIGCTSLRQISDNGVGTTFRIPDSVTSIGDRAFSGCSSSEFYSINIPSGVTSIGQHAFDGCSGMNAVYVYPTTPPTLGNGAFDNMKSNCPIFVPCDSIDAYKAASNWSDYSNRIFGLSPCYTEKYVQIGDTTCVGVDEYYRTIKYISNDGGYSWNITDPVEYGIGDLKLANSYRCGGTEGIAYKATYTSGRTYSASCDSISAVTTSTTKYSGYEYSAMTSAEIGSCVKKIGHRAFINCTALTSVTVNAITPPIMEENPYGGGSGGQFDFTNNCPIYVPCESVAAYKAADGWNTYNSRIQGIPPCEEYFKFKSNISSADCSSDTTLRVYEVASYTGNNGVVYVTIGNCATEIGTNALKGYSNLSRVTIPSSVTSIGNGAFQDCTALTSVTINAVTPPTLSYVNALTNTNDCPIYVPSSSVNAYKSATNWSTYASRIQAIN